MVEHIKDHGYQPTTTELTTDFVSPVLVDEAGVKYVVFGLGWSDEIRADFPDLTEEQKAAGVKRAEEVFGWKANGEYFTVTPEFVFTPDVVVDSGVDIIDQILGGLPAHSFAQKIG